MPALTIEDKRSGSRAKILPELGFNCFAFQAAVNGTLIDVLDAEAGFESGNERPSGSGIPILFPFPSRIREGKFSWGGKDYQLADNDRRGNAIHGFAYDRPWRVTGQTENSATGQFQLSVDAPDRRHHWPADFMIELKYEVRSSTLRCEILIANPDSVALPWGLGTHAYFRYPLSANSSRRDCLAQAPASEEWVLEDLIPTGARRPVSGGADLRSGQPLDRLNLDNSLTAVMPRNGLVQSLVMDTRAGLQISQVTSSEFRELVVYTPPHGRSVCIEPYTCPPDAVNLHNRGIECGWRVLPPGGQFRTVIEISVEPVLA
jgi:aldose 1-epimerase